MYRAAPPNPWAMSRSHSWPLLPSVGLPQRGHFGSAPIAMELMLPRAARVAPKPRTGDSSTTSSDRHSPYLPEGMTGIGLDAATRIWFKAVTEHFTSTTRRPVKEIADSSRTGAATTILSGFSTGLESTVYAILVIAVTIFG